MHQIHRFILSFVVGTFSSATAVADYITINTVGGSYDMHEGEIEGVLGGTNNQFALSDLDTLAATLNNDGIETLGTLSFILANTEAGFSFIGLFDGVAINDPSGGISDQFLGLSTTTTMGTDWFATSGQGSETYWYDMGNNTQLVNSLLGWDHEQTSAGFAWGDVREAQAGTFNLYDVDLTAFAGEPIQFITYEDDQWSVVGNGDFSVLGQHAFSYQFVPAPGALALLTLAALTDRRKRRT